MAQEQVPNGNPNGEEVAAQAADIAKGLVEPAKLSHPSMKEDWKGFDDEAGAAARQLLDRQDREVIAQDGDFTRMKDFDDQAGDAARELLANSGAAASRSDVGGKTFGETVAEMDNVQASAEGQKLDENGNTVLSAGTQPELTHPSMKEDWKGFDDVSGAAANQLLTNAPSADLSHPTAKPGTPPEAPTV